MRFRFLLLTGALLALGLTACEDPSNVGLGLIGGEGGEPEVVTLEAATFEAVPLDDASPDTARTVLAGTVSDPLFGDIQATGYLDFVAGTLSEAFRNNTVTSARLRLAPTYVYGDTTSVLTYELRRMSAEWSFAGASPDTTLSVGDQIFSFSFNASDTLVDVVLPAAWVAENDALLRRTTFASDFHGFQIAAVSGNAVVGFDRAGSSLRAYTSADSASYSVTKGFSGLQRTGQPALSPDRVAVQDGVGPGARMTFDLMQADVQPGGLNRAVVRVFADTTLTATGTSFVRPLLRTLRLYAVDADGEAFWVSSAALDSTGAYAFRSALLDADVQQVLLGNRTIDHFELRVPPATHTLNPVALFDETAAARAPKALLTFTPVLE